MGSLIVVNRNLPSSSVLKQMVLRLREQRVPYFLQFQVRRKLIPPKCSQVKLYLHYEFPEEIRYTPSFTTQEANSSPFSSFTPKCSSITGAASDRFVRFPTVILCTPITRVPTLSEIRIALIIAGKIQFINRQNARA